MSYIKEKVAYLHGLADGMKLGDESRDALLLAMLEAMDAMAESIDENEESIMDLDECLDDMCEEIDDIESYLFDDEDDDEDDDFGFEEYEEDDLVEAICPKCGESVFFDSDMLDSAETLICPACGAEIACEKKDKE